MALRWLACEFGRRFGSAQPAALLHGELLRAAAAATASRSCVTTADGLKYAESHEWAQVEDDSATVGISDFAQKELGDVVYVELPEKGATVTKGEAFGVVESVKAASDVYSPVSGHVLDTNSTLVDDPGMINKDPFKEGWMMKVKLNNSEELDTLLEADAYKAHCEELSKN